MRVFSARDGAQVIDRDGLKHVVFRLERHQDAALRENICLRPLAELMTDDGPITGSVIRAAGSFQFPADLP